MNNLKTETLRNELSSLMAQYDELRFHVVPMLKNEYYRQIGNLKIRIENRRIDLAILKLKNEAERKELTAAECDSLIRKLANEYKEEVTIQNEYPLTTEQDDAEIIDLYVTVLKRLDPVLNVNGFEQKNRLLRMAKEYFMNLDVDGLRMIEYQSRNCNDKETGADVFSRVQLLNREIESYRKRISTVKNSFPYNQIELILDEEKLSQKAGEYCKLLSSLDEEYSRLESIL